MPERKTKILIPPENTPTDGFDVPVEESTERWSEFVLEDGSILRAKPAIGSIVRVPGRFDSDGNPLYVLRGSIMMIVVEAPEGLKQPK